LLLQGITFPPDGQDFEPIDDRDWIGMGILISPDKLRRKNNSSTDTELVGASSYVTADFWLFKNKSNKGWSIVETYLKEGHF